MHARRYSQPRHVPGTHIGKCGPARAASVTIRGALGRSVTSPAIGIHMARRRKRESQPSAVALYAAAVSQSAARTLLVPGLSAAPLTIIGDDEIVELHQTHNDTRT